jgi:hypothetical protein
MRNWCNDIEFNVELWKILEDFDLLVSRRMFRIHIDF